MHAGYARVVCALYAFAVALSSPSRCAGAYFLSFVCDELDGRFARLLGQTSTFGAVLDMVTDRLATTCLLAVLCVLYPGWHLPFLLLIMLDVFSHWFQMYASLAAGSTSHKVRQQWVQLVAGSPWHMVGQRGPQGGAPSPPAIQ